jgi:hypothetical protein
MSTDTLMKKLDAREQADAFWEAYNEALGQGRYAAAEDARRQALAWEAEAR